MISCDVDLGDIFIVTAARSFFISQYCPLSKVLEGKEVRECSVLKMSFLVSFKACGCQHQHVCLNYSRSDCWKCRNSYYFRYCCSKVSPYNLVQGDSGWPWPTPGCLDGSQCGVGRGTWVSAPLSSWGGVLQGGSMFLWQNSA